MPLRFRPMRPLTASLVLLCVLASGCQVASSGGATAKVRTTSSPAGSRGGAASSVDASPDPNVRYDRSCDYLLGDISGAGYRFIARATLHNTGNVGVRVFVGASWVQVGSADVKRARTVRVPWHSSRVVNFTVPVSQGQIDQLQAGLDAGPVCKVKALIADTFGAVH